ncbi:nitrogen regulation protein NR(I) [Oceanospirillaceae bacterium]|jgi:two-component system nitrogen regulation response regulator GlnG|nr:nitrogen regulation protein NR(I) [Oceanospirillaceae bacterium]MBT4999045.1 nitrogen regulation protein NR(I) [Oceanospirillaceae bacterium]MBT5630937.1 nitrogen regulation protein NR(I) [Oceanospirillaceae bacterium]MBT6100888.1 nitrogen regulation protein NR(I) [Oceanospirillaceae bacterium]MBT7675060.1 nitrogen regulation protein NR(I) [Oceanospirillaceae bacterium]
MSQDVWLVDDDHAIRWVLERALQQAQISSRSFEDGQQLLAALEADTPKLIVSDIRMPGIDGLSLLQRLQHQIAHVPVIIMTAHSDLDSAVASYQGGAFDYLPKPFDVDEAVALVQRGLQHAQQQAGVKAPEPAPESAQIIGEAPAMQEVFRAIGRLSQSNMTVMINGASGTGKELIAQALHQHSPRANQPFIPLNMAAIQKDLIESELFGHEKGAFTGAANQRKGHFEQAHGGTLMLDEIGDMPAEAQTRLLRVLADGEFYRVGGHNLVKVDVRIIAATHQDLAQRVEQGLFREDLFHRLNVIRIPLPNLNQRSEDIPALARHFLLTSAKELAVETKQLSSEAAAHLQKLEWPGNVRQLENVCRWLSVMGSGNQILVNDLPPELKEQTPTASLEESWQEVLSTWAKKELQFGQQQLLDKALPAFEKVMIKAALKHTHGRRREAAEVLGWGRNTLTRKISELGL